MRVTPVHDEYAAEMVTQVRLLGHSGHGVTECRTFGPPPKVAYADSEDSVINLVRQMEQEASGIYIGVQPRPPHLFDQAPNCWKPAASGANGNCARDADIEVITALFFDLDAVSDERSQGHPACQEELERTLEAALLLSRQDGLALASTICCSGNGHYVVTPIAPIAVAGNEEARKFKFFCSQLARRISGQVEGVRIDPVYNLSRVMRVMGTVNRKGHPVPGRFHRRAHFVTEPMPAQSAALHHMILNTEIPDVPTGAGISGGTIKCNLKRIESCEFIKWCRRYPTRVSEPQWFALITNLARLYGGPQLAHQISRLDSGRYDYRQTQRLIERIISAGYGASTCAALETMGFVCNRRARCHARAPMYLTDLFSIWKG